MPVSNLVLQFQIMISAVVVVQCVMFITLFTCKNIDFDKKVQHT